MNIVYASLARRQAADEAAAVTEASEVVDIVWAHASSEEHLEHIGGRATAERIDLLFFFLPPPGTDPGDSSEERAAALLHRAHSASAQLQHRYLPPSQTAPGQANGSAPAS